MGRPLNKRFFGNATNKILTSAALGDGGGTPENCSIIKQKSNLKYQVQSESATAITALATGIQYRVVSVGTSDFTTVGGENVVGSIFTATGTGVGTGTTAEVYICTLTDSTPNAIGEMTVLVTPENAETPRQATIAITAAGGTGALLTVTIVDAGYGYWAPATGDSQAGGDGTIDYTVSNGSLATVVINTAGSANTDGTVNIGDTPAANPPIQYARAIHARQVKTFEGNTYDWPTTAPLGTPEVGGLTQADLELQA